MPRAGLNRERVVAAAATIADDVGLERLTLAAVAQQFGVALPSLYKHIGGVDALRRELAILALGELAAELAAATVGRARHDALAGMAHGYRDYARRRPGTYAATTTAPDPGDPEHTAAAAGVLEIVFAVLAGYGIEDDDAVDATRALHAALHGFVSLEHAGSFKMARSVDHSFRRLVRALDHAFAGWTEPDGSP